MDTPHVTAPGASALCACKALGCSSGTREVRRDTLCLPTPGLSLEMSLGDTATRAGGSFFSDLSPDSRGRTLPALGLRPQRARESLTVVMTGCDPREL